MSTTLHAVMAHEIMRPLPSVVTLKSLASEALEVMRRENTEFLPVVTGDTRKLMGVVIRRALELGCANMGHKHSECLLINHLKADVEFCFRDEPIEQVLNERSEAGDLPNGMRDTRRRTRLRLPVIVVDEGKVPIGMIERTAR